MHYAHTFVLAAFTGSVLVMACSSDPAVLYGPRAAREVCGRHYDAYNARTAHCFGTTAEPLLGQRDAYVRACAARAAAPGIADQATQMWLLSFLERCNDTYASHTCDGDSLIEYCKATATGQIGSGLLFQGEACAVGAQCRSGRCVGTATDPVHGCGVCALSHSGGDLCRRDDNCDPGLYCNTEVFSCESRGLNPPGYSCDASPVMCQDGLVCLQDFPGAPPTCRTPAIRGEACVAANTVGAIPPCGADLNCIAGQCQPRASAGAACSPDVQCASPLQCDNATHTCQNHAASRVGDACTEGSCDGLLTCDAVSHTCAPLLHENDNCDVTIATGPVCEPSLACIKGRCTLADPARCQ